MQRRKGSEMMRIVLSRRELRMVLCEHKDNSMMYASLKMTQDLESRSMGLSIAGFAGIPVLPRNRQ